MNNETQVKYTDSNDHLSVPLTGDLASLIAMQEMREIKVHGKPILINANQVDSYLANADTVIKTEEELAQIIERQLSPEDAQKIFNQQLHRKLVGQQFDVSEVGDIAPEATEDLVLVVPEVKMTTQLVEVALESIATDDLTKYVTFLPPQNEAEQLNPIRCVTGNTLRAFLNDMQEEDGGLDMNSQIRVYAKLLTLMPDEDPTKKYGLMQMRALMQYGDIVSNKNLRLALTTLLEEELGNE